MVTKILSSLVLTTESSSAKRVLVWFEHLLLRVLWVITF